MHFTKLRKLPSARGSIWLSDGFFSVHSRHDGIYTSTLSFLVVIYASLKPYLESSDDSCESIQSYFVILLFGVFQ